MKKRMVSLVLAGVMVGALAAPTAAMADTTWTYPTEPMTVDDGVVKVAVHAAASTIAIYLGANNVVERASDYSDITSEETAEAQFEAACSFVKLGVAGSSINENPDPYLWNYFYNKAVLAGVVDGELVDDEVYLSEGAGGPMKADTTVIDELGTSYSLYRRPQILMDTAGSYDDLIAALPENLDDDDTNDYNPIQLDYGANNLTSFINDMYLLADAIEETGLETRYEDPQDIAVKYEAMMKGLQYYVLAQLEEDPDNKKTVAIVDMAGVDTDDDGVPDEYLCYTSSMQSGTAASTRAAEYVENTTNNIIDTLGLESATYDDTTGYYATAADLCEADVILPSSIGKYTEEEIIANLLAADSSLTEEDIPPIQTTDPEDVFSIRVNSVENLAGIPISLGFVYPEYINPIYGTMYIYENFWHVSGDDTLVSLANSNFAEASLRDEIARNGSGYSETDIQEMILTGLEYAEENADEYADTKLAFTTDDDDNAIVTAASVTEIFETENAAKSTSDDSDTGSTGTTGTTDTTGTTNTTTTTGTTAGTATTTLKAQTITAKKTTTKKIKATKLKKKKVTFKLSAKTSGDGKITFTKKSGSAKLKISKAGKVTVKKGTYKKGKTLKMKVTVKAAATSTCKAATKTVTVKVKIK